MNNAQAFVQAVYNRNPEAVGMLVHEAVQGTSDNEVEDTIERVLTAVELLHHPDRVLAIGAHMLIAMWVPMEARYRAESPDRPQLFTEPSPAYDATVRMARSAGEIGVAMVDTLTDEEREDAVAHLAPMQFGRLGR